MHLAATNPWLWPIFFGLVTTFLLIDLFVLNKKDHKPSIKEAAMQSLLWIGVSVLLGAVMWVVLGATAGAQYFTGYIIEKSLSVDNIFVWGVVFSFFAIPDKYKHRVLFWGIFGAKVMRLIFIVTGVALIERFAVTLPILGLILLYSAYKIFKHRNEEESLDISKSRAYKFFTKYVPTSKELDGHKMFTIENGKRVATPLFLCLLVVEVTDLVFAVDSVPAILAISDQTFVIYASNVMAILGLRALFFLFDAIKDKFEYLSIGVTIVLAAIGVKMLASSHIGIGPVHLPGYHVGTLASLIFIATVLTISVLTSVFKGRIPEGA